MGLTEPLLYSQALNYLKSLSRKGIRINILSFEKKEFLTETSIEAIKSDLGNFGIKWTHLIYHKRFKIISKPYDVIKGMIFSMYLSLKENLDVIHVRGTMCGLMAVPAYSFLRKKVIFDMRGLMAEEYVDGNLWKRNSFFYKCVNALERYLINKYDEIVVLTDKIKDLFIYKYDITDVSVIPTCVDLEKFSFNRMHDKLNKKFTIIYTGSVGTWYMLTEMVNFFKILYESDRDTIFIILSQADKKSIEQNIPLNIRKNIIIKSVKPLEVNAYLNESDMGMFFIKPCFSKSASSPTKFAEYLACGLPVIINSGVGDTDLLVRKHRIGVIVDSFTESGYRKAASELKELLKEGMVLKNRCRKVAEDYFSLELGAERYFEIYKKLKQ